MVDPQPTSASDVHSSRHRHSTSRTGRGGLTGGALPPQNPPPTGAIHRQPPAQDEAGPLASNAGTAGTAPPRRAHHAGSQSFTNTRLNRPGFGGGSGASMHAPQLSAGGGNGGLKRGGADPTAAMDNLQSLIQDIKSNPAPSAQEEQQDELSSLGARLAAQEEHLQTQLQQRLGRGTSSTGGGRPGHASSQSFSSRPGGLPSLGEDSPLPDAATLSGRSGPRFAGNAAFQSAIARHAAANANTSGPGAAGISSGPPGASATSHQRQRSLQDRFAEMGFPMPQIGSMGFPEGEGQTDDSGGLPDFASMRAFDPTRGGMGQQQNSRGSHHPSLSMANFETTRRNDAGFDLTGAAGRTGSHGHSTSMGGGLYAENLALQQQIEMLQLQQQQLLQQQIQFNPSTSLGGQPQPQGRFQTTSPINRTGGHRRIQSHAPQSGPIGSFSTGAPPFGQNTPVGVQPAAASALPRGHGRRHSVNVLNKSTGGDVGNGVGANTLDYALSPPGPDYAFATQQQVAAPPPQVGHFSHPSVQLASLSPEYLMAGGGLVNFSALQSGVGDIADGFGGGGGGTGAVRGHGRTGSQSWRINGTPSSYNQTTDLAQAQAQLNSLNQFRAQAGMPSHGKNANFGGGFNPNIMGGQYGGQQQVQGQQGPGGVQRKALFGSYLPQASLPPLLAAGKIVVGVLRVNKRNRSDAWVATEVLQSDIFISGSKDRNRALDGDVVAVELLDPAEVWSIKKEKEDKKKRKEESGPGTQQQQSTMNLRKPDKAKDDLEVEGSQLRLIDDEEDNEDAPPALAGHVVAIIERVPSKLFSGTIGLLRPSSAATKEKQQAERVAREGGDATTLAQQHQQRPKIIWFRPSDKRCPLVAIPADQAPADFWDDSDAYKERLFLCSIKRWPLTSLHPFGTLVEELGVIGNKDALSAAIFKECLSLDETFTEATLKCLPPLPWSIPEREYETRRDLRENCIFTIDPPTAKDLDDAVSVNRLDGGLFEIGVHIADVSYFIKMGSALDREARKRSTSVYMVERMIPMLPPALSEELCSLRPGVERLAYSAIFTMNKDGRVIGSWMGRSIIKSCAQLAYSDAQAVIDGKNIDASKLHSHSAQQVESDIQVLHDLAQKMRVRRFENGAIRVDNVKLSFSLDEDGLPTDAIVYEQKEAQRLIEEFMLLANMSVAQHIAAGMPDLALLRRHEKPLDRRIAGFEKRAQQMGITTIDTSSGGALHRTLQGIEDEQARKTLEALVTKSMLRAKYFCTGMVDIAKYSHYALNVPLYTHFTSPIRRYADVMVHRQLDAVLGSTTDKFSIDAEGMAKIAQQCNVKRDAAKLAQEQSDHLFLCLLIHDLTVRYGPVVRQGTVMGVLDAAFDVIVHEFGIEKRVHVDQIPVEHHSYDEVVGVLNLWWSRGKDTIEWLSEHNDDAHLNAIRGLAQRHKQQQDMRLASQSTGAEAALFDDDDDDEALAAVRHRVYSGEDAQGSQQRTRSFEHTDIPSQGAKVTAEGHHIQQIKELQTLPVVITADMDKAPPVIKMFAVNPWGHEGAGAGSP